MSNWKKGQAYRNVIKKIGPNAYISFNPDPPIASEGPETAIVSDGCYFILLGDWREAYDEAYEKDGFGGCLRLFEEKRKEYEGSWSNAPSSSKDE